MTRTLLFHAGMPKTGTTSIQNACFAAREALLAEDGILYPSIAANHTNAICTLFMDDPTRHISNKMADIRTREAVTGLQARYRASLVHDLETTGWSKVLVSAEGVANLSRKELEGLRDWFGMYVDRIEVVYYLREPIAYTTSVSQQLLKGGVTLGDLHHKPELPNWKGRLNNAIGAFGRERVAIRDFGTAARSEGGLVADFCGAFGFGPAATAAVLAKAQRDNESLSLEAAQMLSDLNTLRPLFTPEGRSGRRTGKETLTFEALPGNRFVLPLAVRQTVHERTRDDIAWVNATFGTSLYETDPPQEGDSPVDPARQTEAAHATALLVSDLLNAVEALRHCLRAREMAEAGNPDGARDRLAAAARLSPEDEGVAFEIKRIRGKFKL
ncbi:hypothetical protein [Acuticoccus sediminis]|uniref:hypothetical protein n=1 Tax=Acuticoccus sediminis TaxID=2184697 RepID=UPI001CFCE55F|nr:hypothetical protein [Acuticoccus sediminis]